MSADVRYDVSPIGTGANYVTKAGGFDPFMHAVVHALMRSGHPESEAIEVALGAMKRWASGGGKVTAKTRAKAAASVARWEQIKATAHATPNKRDPMLESGSAGLLLPKGPVPKVHLPRGKGKCVTCGLPPSAPVHLAAVKARKARAGVRHAGAAGHQRVQGGHVTTAAQHRIATSRAIDAHAATIETQATKAMRRLFASQQKAVLSRLQGARGRRTIRAAQPQDDGEPTVPVDASQVFDTAFWTDQTAQALAGVYDTAQSLTTARMADALHPGVNVPQAVQSVEQVLAQRARTVGAQISRTTYDAIAAQLADGLQAGEPVGKLADRIKGVFSDADRNRAEMIARTEAIGSLNQAGQSYAQALPAGIVAYKEWVATEDNRTRPAHREADGQQRNVTDPFMVGGFPMMQPGDPTAPPSDVINCRCRAVYQPRRLAAVPAT